MLLYWQGSIPVNSVLVSYITETREASGLPIMKTFDAGNNASRLNLDLTSVASFAVTLFCFAIRLFLS